MIVTNRETGLRPGDSRYPYKCDKCYRAVGTVQRKHTSVEQGKARAPDNLRPGGARIVGELVSACRRTSGMLTSIVDYSVGWNLETNSFH